MSAPIQRRPSQRGRPVIASLALAAGLWAFAAGAAAQTRLLPVDEAASVPDFFSFRAQLQSAVARRDVAAVQAVIAPDAKLSFGGHGGLAGFQKLWRPTARDTRLWDVLGSVLALGGTFGADGSFTAPYVFARWPEDKDAFGHVAAIGTGVRVRAAANAQANVVGALDFSVVELAAPAGGRSPWVRVKLPGGESGFVDARLVRSPVDYRVNFAKRDGSWLLQFFVAGD